MILLAGEVGMGKTLLIDALRAEPILGQVAWADGICLAYGSNPQRLPVHRPAARFDWNFRPAPAPRKPRNISRSSAADLFGEARLDSTYPYLARFMGLPLSGDAGPAAGGSFGRKCALAAF